MTIGIDARLWSKTGVGRYIRNLVLNLQELDKNNRYILFALKEDLPDLKAKIKNPAYKIVESDIRWHTFFEQTRFLKVLESERLDLMHFPYISVPIFYRKPFLVTVHDLIPYHFSTGQASTLPYPLYLFKRTAYKLVLKTAAKNAKKIIVPLNAVKSDVSKTLKVDPAKIIVTYEGAKDGQPDKGGAKTLRDKYGRYLLYVGNAYPHKNLKRLIEAFSELEEKDIKLMLVGRKDYFYQRLEQQTSSKNVIFFGFVNDEELSAFYRNALALVQPSMMEGFGLPVLEAMVNRCPVVCSDIPSLTELTKGNAVYFNPEDTKDMKLKLESVIGKKEEYRELIEKAFERSKEFSWEKMTKETIKIYESAV